MGGAESVGLGDGGEESRIREVRKGNSIGGD